MMIDLGFGVSGILANEKRKGKFRTYKSTSFFAIIIIDKLVKVLLSFAGMQYTCFLDHCPLSDPRHTLHAFRRARAIFNLCNSFSDGNRRFHTKAKGLALANQRRVPGARAERLSIVAPC